ncbi:nucleoside/nucleotide kinase family protein [Streptomyces sp. NPDC001922]|uniref:nucleoside/nucleotide kinase family protein n=1 Tax=Streptomyces sp. NPDC001922 TaxID=3364624 RepID=UPI00367433A1
MEIHELAADAWRLAEREPGPRVVLGLVGPPAAGKSTLARALVAEVERRRGPGAAGYLPLDGFHLSNAQLDRLGLASRKGSAPSFDVHGYAALLHRTVTETGHAIYVPDYDRTLHEPVAARHLIRPGTRLVVTEGNYLACDEPGWTAARRWMAEVWYVDAPVEVRDRRLVARQLAGGRTAAEARAWVDTNDRPNGEQVERVRGNCDRVLPPIGLDISNGRD